MWTYEKRLQYPVKISKTCPKTAQLIISQFGGPDGELAASMRYLSQRYTMPCKEVAGLLTDIGTEELAHLEIVCAIIYQLTKDMSPEDAKTAGFDAYYIDHTSGLWPQAAGGIPFNACEFQSKGDAITDLFEDLAAEQKARTTYDNILRVVDDPGDQRSHPVLTRKRGGSLPAFRRSIGKDQRQTGCKELLLCKSGVR